MLKRVALHGEDVMAKAYGYTRVSTMEQATGGDSLTVQRQAIERHAKALGKRLAHVYVDEGVSGSKSLEKRPQGRALLLAVQRGDIQRGDVIIASQLDRVFRSAQDAHNLSAIFRKRGSSRRLRAKKYSLRKIAASVQERLGLSISHVGVGAVLNRSATKQEEAPA